MASTQDRRIELHNILKDICQNVYFSPPAGKQLVYPCIIYNRDYSKAEYADNTPYMLDTRYTVIAIDPNPDSELVHKLELLPKCRYDRYFVSDNLNHDVFTIYH